MTGMVAMIRAPSTGRSEVIMQAGTTMIEWMNAAGMSWCADYYCTTKWEVNGIEFQGCQILAGRKCEDADGGNLKWIEREEKQTFFDELTRIASAGAYSGEGTGDIPRPFWRFNLKLILDMFILARAVGLIRHPFLWRIPGYAPANTSRVEVVTSDQCWATLSI